MLMERIRLATPEEVDTIKGDSNLTPMSRVLAWEGQLAVHRIANEIDPLHPNGASPRKMYMFLWGIQNILAGSGVTEVYFNTPADDLNYHKVLEELGAERISKQPDYRWRMAL